MEQIETSQHNKRQVQNKIRTQEHKIKSIETIQTANSNSIQFRPLREATKVRQNQALPHRVATERRILKNCG